MKLIKKIAAIMFAFMMVFSLSTNAKANSGSQATNGQTGTITIKNAKKDETYNVYKVLTLDSYDKTEGLYSYLPANDAWENYFEHEGNTYMHLNDDGFVETDYTDNDAQVLAQQLIKKAKEIAQTSPEIERTVKASQNGDLDIKGLSLGYYVIDTTVGTLCALTTTDSNATIEQKHEEPTVSKAIDVSTSSDTTHETVKIGDSIHYTITIDVKPGATKYELHDKLYTGLKYYENPKTNKFNVDVSIDGGVNGRENDDYTFKFDNDEKNAFTITFKDDYIQKALNKQINVKYFVSVTKDAPMDTAIKNDAYLKYGAAQETTHSSTSVFTYQIPVHKYTGEGKNEKPLPNAIFNLYKDSKADGNLLGFDAKSGDDYTYNPNGTVTDLVSGDNGNININGLSAGTYILEETKAPDGYNKLKDSITIVVTKDGNAKQITKNGVLVNKIDVQNKSGSLLPSTGGMGTTLIYLVGGVLVLGSGFVLANKKRAKAK